MTATRDETATGPVTRPGVAARHRPGRGRLSPALAAITGLALVVGGLLLGLAAVTLVGLVLSVAAAVRGPSGWPVAVPLAALAAVATSVTVMTAASLAGVDLTAHRRLVAGLLVGCSSACLLVSARRDGGRSPSAPGRWSVLAYTPALLALGVGALQALATPLVAPWALLGTDIAEHTNLLGDVQATGSLSYAHLGYPRGLQALLALVAAPAAEAPGSGAELRQDLVLVAASVWIAFGCLLCAGAAVTRWAARTAGRSDREALCAAGVLSWFLVSWLPFQISFVHMGAAPSLLAVVVLWGWCVVAAGPGPVGRLLVATALAVLLLTHLWQALALVPAVGFLVVVARPGVLAVRQGSGPRRTGGLLLVAAAVALSLPPVLGVLRQGGLSIAAIGGDTPGVPVVLGVLSLAAVLGLCRLRGPVPGRRAFLGVVLGLVLVVAALTASAGHGLDLRQYYPMKALWFTVLVTGPVLAIACVRVLDRARRVAWRFLDTRPAIAAPAKLGLAAAAWLLLAVLVLPGLLGASSMVRAAALPQSHSNGERRLDVATSYGHRFAPAVAMPVALGLSYSPVQYGPYIVAKLLRFQTGQPVTYGAPAEVCRDAAAVRRALGREVVVITDVAPDDLQPFLVAGGCADLRVVQVPGAAPGVVAWFSKSLRHDAAALSQAHPSS